MSLTAVSLFAGVGGFDLAMERNGIDVVAAVEIDEKARAVLARQFPNTRLFADVTKVSSNELRDAGFVPDRGIITGGFPCQDLSVAGRRAGLAGERSGLFWHIIRLVDELHPRWIVLENVPGLLSSEGGRDMGIVLGALGECGYGVSYRVLDAQHFGVPQRRRRVFIVAGRRAGAADSAGPVQVLLESEGSSGNPAACRTAGQEPAGTAGNGFAGRRIVNALTRDGLGGGGPDDNLAQAGHLIPQQPSIQVAIQAASEQSLESISSSSKDATREREREREREIPAASKQQQYAISGKHHNDRDGAKDGPRYRISGDNVMNTISASIYHHGTVVNQDLMSGHLVIVDE
ncbi:MAG: DNA cytosine methyltransferase [Terrimicrobiaceae bacterium]